MSCPRFSNQYSLREGSKAAGFLFLAASSRAIWRKKSYQQKYWTFFRKKNFFIYWKINIICFSLCVQRGFFENYSFMRQTCFRLHRLEGFFTKTFFIFHCYLWLKYFPDSLYLIKQFDENMSLFSVLGK